MYRLYGSPIGQDALEECIYIDGKLSQQQLEIICWLFRSPVYELYAQPRIPQERVREVGPRIAVETPFSTRAVEICERVGIPTRRIEVSKRYDTRVISPQEITQRHFDPMTQELYPAPLETFGIPKAPKPARTYHVLSGDVEALRDANRQGKFGLDEALLGFYLSLFEADPTDTALALIGAALSEHSRHGTIKSPVVLDGVRKPSIMQLVQAPWKAYPGNTLVAFHDNAGVIRGPRIRILMPEYLGDPSRFVEREVQVHITMTAETHNHPSWVSPVPGAETGVGGMLRDMECQGRGALLLGIICAGYATASLHISGYSIPGEVLSIPKSNRYASPLQALIGMSNGACDYANKMGRPITFGFCRSFEQEVSGVHRGWFKPICYVGGVARVDDRHVFKNKAAVDMLIMGAGGAARRIGVLGAQASSAEGGTNTADIDFASVQRGDAIEESDLFRFLRAAAQMGDQNPLEDLSDQGAGGPGNLFLELVGTLGGQIDLRRIRCADPSMSALELLIGEYQERCGFLIKPENRSLVRALAEREGVHLEELGRITGDGRFVVVSANGTVVDLSIAKTLGKFPQKELVWNHVPKALPPLVIPEGLTVAKALKGVLAQLSVCSKGFLVRKGDRSVGGRVAQQQCCGPLQLPVADASVMADSFYGITGSVSALGEQPIVGLIDAKAQGRLSVAEMLTNMGGTVISAIPDIGVRLNEMWAASQPGEAALLYEAVEAACEMMGRLTFAPNGGKDSLSMAAKTAAEELVVAPGEIVVFGTAPVPDITKVATPDLKCCGGISLIGLIDIGRGKNRLGGSAFAQSLGQLGNAPPDIDDEGQEELLDRALKACQQLIAEGTIRSYHDRSDGGFLGALVEMCTAGNCGARVHLPEGTDLWGELFAQEVGILFEVPAIEWWRVREVMREHQVPLHPLSIAACAGWRGLEVRRDDELLLNESLVTLRRWWEATSDQLEMLQAHPVTVAQEVESYGDTREIPYTLSFTPTAPAIGGHKPKMAVMRAQGTNGDDEMTNFFALAGFEVYDIALRDILLGTVTSLREYRGIVDAGGFADGDVLGSAKGWAAPIRFDSFVAEMFRHFYERSNTFSLGVCNGFQKMVNTGWLPYRGLPEASQPRLVHNLSTRFESRWVGVMVPENPAVLLRGMAGSILPVWSAHGEGRLVFPDPQVADDVRKRKLVPLVYVDPDGKATEQYPFNPNGSQEGWAGLCSPDGRHVAVMPHPERCFRWWQWAHVPEQFRRYSTPPWLQIPQNAYQFCKDA